MIEKFKKHTMEQVFRENRNLSKIKDTPEGNVYIAQDNEIVYLELLIRNFTIHELSRITKISEDLYDEFKTKVTAYVICTEKIMFENEIDIPSEAHFIIKLANININMENYL